MNYTIWHSDKEVQVIPEGEEHIHQLDITCGCEPQYHMHNHEIVQTVHKSFMGENFGQFFYSPVKQTKDC